MQFCEIIVYSCCVKLYNGLLVVIDFYPYYVIRKIEGEINVASIGVKVNVYIPNSSVCVMICGTMSHYLPNLTINIRVDVTSGRVTIITSSIRSAIRLSERYLHTKSENQENQPQQHLGISISLGDDLLATSIVRIYTVMLVI